MQLTAVRPSKAVQVEMKVDGQVDEGPTRRNDTFCRAKHAQPGRGCLGGLPGAIPAISSVEGLAVRLEDVMQKCSASRASAQS